MDGKISLIFLVLDSNSRLNRLANIIASPIIAKLNLYTNIVTSLSRECFWDSRETLNH
jgi:hypothetical protein